MTRAFLFTMLLSVVIGFWPLPARAAPTCQFAFGFRDYQAVNATIVGDCISDEEYAANGDGIQYTTNGYLVWTKATNTLTFIPKGHGDPFIDRFSQSSSGPAAMSPPLRVHHCGDPDRYCHVELAAAN